MHAVERGLMLVERKEKSAWLDAGENRSNWEDMPNQVNGLEF